LFLLPTLRNKFITWKATFSTPEGAFEPMVIFFGLTNSPATFSTIMNGLLRDMIKIGDVAVFINDVMVGTETEEGYDNIIKEVLRRIVENDLFVKLEKLCRKLERLDF